jgi:uncharacterized SAM-binding protein YcdF (DUF218 family)
MGDERGVPRGTLRFVSILSLLVLGVLGWCEFVHWRASRRGFPGGADALRRQAGHGVIVVLGVANRGHRANVVNRWRARMALRSVPSGVPTTIVTSGGAVRGPVPEATLLALHLRETLGWRGTIIEETASRSTWNNVENVLPWLDEAAWIMLVSNSLHAEKARELLRRQRPDLAVRLVPAADYRFGEMALVKPVLGAVGLLKLATLRRSVG